MKKILVIGSLNLDIVVRVDHMPEVGETIVSKDMEMIPGGKGANQAYAVGKLGNSVALLGAVGKDAYGDILMNSLCQAGADVSKIAKRKENTGLALITVNGEGDNSIVVVAGANSTVDEAYIDENEDAIKDADIIIFQLEIPIETVLYAAQKAKKFGKTVILDPAPVPEEFPEELYSCIDVIKPNETELRMLIHENKDIIDLIQATKTLREKGIKDVIVTLGERGVFINSEEAGIVEIPALKVNAVDTTAAGDSFTAALAVMLSQGKDIRSAAEFANKVASIVVTRRGAQSSIPTKSEVYTKLG